MPKPALKKILSSSVAPILGAAVSFNTFDFRTGVDAFWTNTRSGGTSASYIDSNGEWVQASTNEIRQHHTPAGVARGILIERDRTNLANHENFAPTGAGGISVISGTGTISDISDTGNLITAATLDGASLASISDGNVYELVNTGGGTCIFRISLDCGSTNRFSYRILVKPSTSGNQGAVRLNDNTARNDINFTAGTWNEIEEEDFTPALSTRYIQVTVNTGASVRIAAFQLEENYVLSSPIITTGAAGATRGRDNISTTDLTSLGVNEASGAIIALTEFGDVDEDANGFYGVVNSGNTMVIANRAVSSRSYCEQEFTISGSDQITDECHKYFVDQVYPTGSVWDNTEIQIFGGFGMRTKFADVAATPTGLEEFWLGKRREFNDHMEGVMQQIVVYGSKPSLADVAKNPALKSQRGKVSWHGGQSNEEGKDRSHDTFMNGGAQATVAELDNFYFDGQNASANFASGNSELWDNAVNDNYWLEGAPGGSNLPGPLLRPALDALAGMKESVLFGFWNQGESDSDKTVDELKEGTLAVFEHIRTVIPGMQFIIRKPGRRTANPNDGFYRKWHQAYQELADENSFIHLAPGCAENEMLDETGVTDDVHFSNQGYTDIAVKDTRKALSVIGEAVTGNIDGPAITNVNRSGTTVTVTLTHDNGTDFTPTTGIEGFEFLDDGTPITINSAVRTNSTTITLTLDSAPTGTEVIGYANWSMVPVSPANIVVDNDATHPLSLRPYSEQLN